MTWLDALVLFGGGLLAGVINAMAGGGFLLTVPLLSLAGVEGLAANGTNRVAVLFQTITAGIGGLLGAMLVPKPDRAVDRQHDGWVRRGASCDEGR